MKCLLKWESFSANREEPGKTKPPSRIGAELEGFVRYREEFFLFITKTPVVVKALGKKEAPGGKSILGL